MTVSGKETCGGATGTMSVCLFSLSVSQKRVQGEEKKWSGGGGAAGMSFRRMCAKAFIATVNIYSSGGIPWM